MAIVEGDVTQYSLLKRLSVEDYLVKLTNFIDRIEPYLKHKTAATGKPVYRNKKKRK